MSGPFIVVTHVRVPADKVAEYEPWVEKFCGLVEEREPRLLAFHVYADASGETSAVVQVHPDAESMEFHFQVMRDELEQMHDHQIDVESVRLYGTPSERVQKAVAGYGDRAGVVPRWVAGLTRLG